MPSAFAPSKNGAHRLACLSLYRTFLKRCGDLCSKTAPGSSTSNKSSSDTLKSLVRYRFKHDKKIKNWQQIRNALHFGRGVFQLLDHATSGSSEALEELSRILSASVGLAERNKKALSQLREECRQSKPSARLKEGKAREAILANPLSYQRKPTTIPITKRPLPYEQAAKHSDGRRRVPDYFVVQGIPFLRYHRPQPLPLSLYIGDQILKHEKLWKDKAEGDQMVQIAGFEDEWDKQMAREHNVQQQDSQSWQDTYRVAQNDLQFRVNRLDSKRLEDGKKLWEVYLKEEKLAAAENAKRKEENRRRWEERQKKEAQGDAEETKRVAQLFEAQDGAPR